MFPDTDMHDFDIRQQLFDSEIVRKHRVKYGIVL